MRIISQTIHEGTITVNGEIIAKSGFGLALFVGFTHDDNDDIIDKMVAKILVMRLLPDINGKTNLSVPDLFADILIIPNFTLYGSLNGGRRPSFTMAAPPQIANTLFERFILKLNQHYSRISCGIFGASMTVTLKNAGPFTIILDSKELYEH